MKPTLAAARLLSISAAWAILPFATPLHGASPGFPFAEDFQSQSLLNSTDTTARWTSSVVTLGRARGVHESVFTMQDRPVGAVGNAEIFDIALQDINGDGRLDIVTAGPNGVVVYFNDPASGFSLASSTVVTTTSSHLLTFGDYDRDGDLDIIAGSWLRRSNVILHKNDGRGGFDSAAIDSSVPDLVANGLATADIDGDGHLDLAIALQGREGGVDLYRNDGNGGFRHQDTVDSGGPHRDIQMGDLNGDGRPDIVLVKDGVGGFHLNSFNPARPDVWRFESMTSFSSRTGTRLVLGDVNNDSHLDIVVSVRSARNSVHLNNGSGVFGSAFISPNRTSLDVALGDIDGDGDLDVVEGNIRHRRGFSFIYTNDGSGNFDTNGSRILLARSRAVALGDVDNDGDLDIVFGNQNAALRVKVNPGITAADAPSDSLFDTGHGRVVSGKVNGDAQVPHIVFLTATEVQQAHTEIEYYLSNDGGEHWVRGYPGESVRFLARGNDLRWRAELKSRSSTLTPTLTRVGIENVLQVSIDGDVFRGNEIYTATSQTTQKASTPVTIRLLNRGDRALTITGIETVREAFVLQDRQGETLPQPLSIEIEGKSHADFRLVFEPERRGTTDSTLTIFGSEGDRAFPEVKVGLRGRGLAPEIGILDIDVVPIGVRVGTSGSQTVTIENNGEELLRVRTPTITNPQYSLANPAAFPVTATAGNFVEIGFWFEPEKPGTATTDIIFPSNADKGTQTTTLEAKGVAPVIEIPPPALVSVREGGRTTGEIVIRNTGDWNMAITAVTGTDTVFDFVSPTTASINGFGLMVPRESSETVVFSFRPQMNARSSPTANIVFTSDAFNETQTEVILKGRGTAPEVGFDKSQLPVDFGNVRFGQSVTRTVVIENIGDEPLIVSGVVSAVTDSVPGVFSWEPPTEGAASQTVPAGESALLGLRFTPAGKADFDDQLMIDSDAVNMFKERLTVEGEGVASVMAIAITSTDAGNPKGSTASVVLHDFGDVTINDDRSRKVIISNELGTASLTAGIPAITERFFQWKTPPPDTIVLAEHDSTSSLILVFEPEERGPRSATLVFPNDALNGTQTVILRGRGTGAEMELRVGGEILLPNTTHTVSGIWVNRSTEVRVEVRNIGNVSMKVNEPMKEDRTEEGFMPLGNHGQPRVVTENQSVIFIYEFKPNKRGTATTLVTFKSDAVSSGEQTIILHSKGVGPVISTVPGAILGVRFDDVRVGKSTDEEVLITNKGDFPLMITSLAVTNTGAKEVSESVITVVNPPEFPKELSVGTTLSLTLRFTPEDRDGVGGLLLIGSDTVDGGGLLPIFGQGLAAEISIIITATDAVVAHDGSNQLMLETVSYGFGNVPVGTSASAKVSIANEHGNTPLRVGIEEINNPHFRWENYPEGGVVDLDARTSSSLILTFEPKSHGVKTAGFVVESDAYNATRTDVTLTGEGLGAVMELRVGDKRLVPGMAHIISATRVHASTTVAVAVHNLGNAPMEIDPPAKSDRGAIEGFALVGADNMRKVVTGGQSVTFRFRLSPDERGTAVTDITFASDAASSGNQTITLNGKAVAPEMVVWVGGERRESGRAPYDFGKVLIGKTASRTVVIRNDGDAPLEVSSVVARLVRFGHIFTVSSDHRTWPVVIDVGSSKSWTLSFEPLDDRTRVPHGALEIDSDGFAAQDWSLDLEGRGVEPVIEVMAGGMTLGLSETINLRTPPNVAVTTDIIVWNRGSADLTVHDIGLWRSDGLIVDALGHYNLPGGGMTIPENSSHTWTLHFIPPDVATTHAELIRIVSSDKASPFDLKVRGVGVGPDLVTSFRGCSREQDIHCHLDDIRAGATTSVELTISNRGNELLTGTVRMTPGNRDYRVYRINGSEFFRINLGPDEIITRTITFSPWDANPIPPGQSSKHRRAVWVKIRTNDPVERERVIDVWGQIVGPEMHVDIGSPVSIYTGSTETRKREHDFGDVTVGTSATVPLTIRNVGNRTLTATVSVSGGAYRLLNEDGSSAKNRLITIGAGLNEPLDLRFVPPIAPAPYEETLTITSNDHDEGVYEVALTGRGTGNPAMVVKVAGSVRRSGGEFHFGERQVSMTKSVMVRIENMGNATLDLDMTKPVRVETTGTDFLFLERPELPVSKLRPTVDERRERPYRVGESAPTILAGSSSTFMLHFTPGVPSREDNGRLVINSNDPNHPEWKLNLEGSGRGALMRVTLIADDKVYIHPTQTHVHDVGDVLVNERLGGNDLFVRLQNLGNENLDVTLGMAEGSEGFQIKSGEERHIMGENWVRRPPIIFQPTRPGNHTGTVVISSNDDFLREFRIQLKGEGLAPDIDVQAVDFGDVQIDGSSSAEVVVHNRGGALLTITDAVRSANSQFSDDIRPLLPISVQPGESSTLSVSFSPTMSGVSSTTLTFTSNAYGKNSYAVTLEGRGRGKPRMEVTIDNVVRRHEGVPYQFAPQKVGTTASVEVTISNKGNDDLRITSIETTPTSFRFLDRPPAGISVLHPSLPERHRLGYTTTGDIGQPVAAGSSATFMLHFSPSLPSSEDNALLTIRSNDPDHPAWSLNLEGRGTSRMLRVRLFIGDDAYDNFADTEVYDVGDGVVSQTFSLFSGHVPAYKARASAGFKPPKASARVRLHSMGDIPVTIESVGQDNNSTGFSRIEDGWRGSSPNGTWAQYKLVFFEPTQRGIHTGTIVIKSDDDLSPVMKVRLRGRGIAPGIHTRVDNFGDVPVGGSSVTEVAVLNDGDAPLTVKGVAVAADSPFEADVVPSELPVVQPGLSSTFHVSFAPVELGVSTAALILTSDALGEPEHRVVLRGNGVKPENTLDIEVGGQAMTSHAPFNFGRVRVGKTTAVAVTVSNRGVSGLRLKPQVEGHGYSLADSAAKTVTQGVPGTWILRFQPEIRGAHQSTLTIVDVDNPLNSRAWGLTGFGHGPQIKVAVGDSAYNSGTDYGFGTISYGSATTAVVKITNKGNSALNIKSIKVTPEKLEYSAHLNLDPEEDRTISGNGAIDTGYSLVNSNIRIIPSSNSASFELHFTPVIPIANDSVLTIVSDDPEHPEWNLNLTGRGTGPFLAFFNSGRIRANNTLFIVSADVGSEYSPNYVNFDYVNLGDSVLRETAPSRIAGEGFNLEYGPWGSLSPNQSPLFIAWPQITFAPTRAGIHTGTHTLYSNDRINPEFTIRLQGIGRAAGIAVAAGGSSIDSLEEYNFGDIPVNGSSQTRVEISNGGNGPVLSITDISVNGNEQFNARITPYPLYPVTMSSGTDSWSFDLSFAPTEVTSVSARLVISSNAHEEGTFVIRLRGKGVPAEPAPSAWADGVQRPATPAFAESEPDGAPRFVGLGYADGQSRLWLAFDEPAQILSGADARTLSDGALLSGFEVLPNYDGGDSGEDIGVLRARYRSGGVVMDLARNIVPADASVWVRYTPPSDGVSGIYDLASPPNRISSVRLFMLPRSAVLDYDGDGFPDALEARLGGNPLVADDVTGLPEVALLRAGAVGSPAAVAYSGIRADGVAAHLGVVTTGASSLAAYYLSDTFGYSGGYALGVDGYGCAGRFPADYASPLFGGGCAVVDFNNIRAGVEHRIGWLATNAAGYWAVAQGTASRLPEQVVLRVPEFNMKRRNVFVSNSAADAPVVVGAFHDGPASSQSLTVSLSNVAAVDSPSSKEPDGFSVSVVGVTTDTTSYAITGVQSGEDGKLWLAGDPLSSLTPDKYSLGKVTQTDVVRLGDDSLPPLFGRVSLYEGSTASENERHAVVVRGTENYIALLPVVQGSAQTASAFEVSPWDGAGGGPVAVDDRILAVNETSPVADGALVRIAFTASNPPATVRNTVSLEVAASSAGASTATTVLTWPVIDSADALASIAGDGDNDGIPDARDSYRLLNRLPVSVAGGVSGYPDRSSAGADGWHHIRPLSPLHSQHVGSYATRAGLSFQTGFAEDGQMLVQLYITTPEEQSPLAADYQPGVPIQMNYADFAASLSHGEFNAMARQSRQDIAVVYNFRLHGVEPSVAEDTSLAGGRAGVVIPLPESLRDDTNILPLHYAGGAWIGFSTEPDTPAAAGFAPLQAGVCPDDSGVAGSPYRTENGVLNTRKRTGDACMVLYLTDGAAADRDGNINGVVEALIGLAVIVLPRTHPTAAVPHSH